MYKVIHRRSFAYSKLASRVSKAKIVYLLKEDAHSLQFTQWCSAVNALDY